MKHDREALERDAVSRLSAGDLTGAATSIVAGYGPEILGFLVAILRDEDAGNEAFSMFMEDLWRGLPGFAQRSSVRVWAYTLARHAAIRLRSSPHRRRNRNLPLSGAEALSKLVAQVRTDTAPFLKTELKERVAELRQSLSEEDRALLVLRVDRKLEWVDVARVLFPLGGEHSERTLGLEVARLRKRFQLVKNKIWRLAKEQGLLDEPKKR